MIPSVEIQNTQEYQERIAAEDHQQLTVNVEVPGFQKSLAHGQFLPVFDVEPAILLLILYDIFTRCSPIS